MKYIQLSTASIPLILENYFTDKGDEQVVAIIVGANNGEIDDFLTPHLTRKNLRGLLIEPLRSAYLQLTQKFSEFNNLSYENAAISKRNGRSFIYKLQDDAQNKNWQNGISSFHKRIILSHENEIEHIKKLIIKEPVNCITFKSLVRKHKITNINLLQIDTEGYDYEILKQIDFDSCRPDIIIYEYLHLTFYEYYASIEFLTDRGYLVKRNECSMDIIAINKQLL